MLVKSSGICGSGRVSDSVSQSLLRHDICTKFSLQLFLLNNPESFDRMGLMIKLYRTVYMPVFLCVVSIMLAFTTC